jgi:thioesterase domain-containing protein
VQRWQKIVIRRDIRAWIELANTRALRGYDLHPIAAPILYFAASDTHHWGAVDYWRQLTTCGFQSVEIAASHFTMLYEPSASIMAHHLDEALQVKA